MLDGEGVEEVVEVPIPDDTTNSHRYSAQLSAVKSTSGSTATAITTPTDANYDASSTTAATASTDAEAEDIYPDILMADSD